MSTDHSTHDDRNADYSGAILPTGGRQAPSGSVVRADFYSPSEQEGPEEAVRSLSSTIGMFLRFKWLILGVFVLVAGAALPAIWLFVHPMYKARAKIAVAPTSPALIPSSDEQGELRTYGVFMNTQMATLLSPVVLGRALDHSEVQNTSWYHEQPRTLKSLLGGASPSRIERLQDTLKVDQVRATELIEVALETQVPDDADKVVNAIVKEYIRYNKEASDALEAQLFDALRNERASLEKEIEGLVEQKATLSKQLGTDDPDIVRAQIATQLGELEMQRKEIRRKYEGLLYALERKKETDAAPEVPASQPAADDSKFRYAADPEWSRLNRALESAKLRLQIGQQNLGKLNPQLRELEAAVEHNRHLLAQREEELGPTWQPPQQQNDRETGLSLFLMPTSMLAWQADMQSKDLELLDKQIDDLKKEQAQKGELAKSVAQISDQLNRKQELYDKLMDRLQKLEIEQKAPARISIASLAVKPSSPSTDKRILLSVMALAAAFFAGLGIAHLVGSIDPKVCEAGDVEDSIRVPFLGQLPVVASTASPLIDSDPMLMECMRMVRTALLKRLAGTDRRAFMVTSASSRAGKTSVSIQLAYSLAQMGKKTLLVEADLRRPTVAGRIGIESETGLAALLCGTASDDEAIIRSVAPGLDVVVAGRLPEDFNSERLTNGAFSGCLTRWKGQYDFVVIDTPPVLPVADTRIMASQTDGSIMVSRASHSRRADVVQACADLSAVGGTILGAVLVGARAGSRYGYRSGYETYVNAYRVLED